MMWPTICTRTNTCDCRAHGAGPETGNREWRSPQVSSQARPVGFHAGTMGREGPQPRIRDTRRLCLCRTPATDAVRRTV